MHFCCFYYYHLFRFSFSSFFASCQLDYFLVVRGDLSICLCVYVYKCMFVCVCVRALFFLPSSMLLWSTKNTIFRLYSFYSSFVDGIAFIAHAVFIWCIHIAVGTRLDVNEGERESHSTLIATLHSEAILCRFGGTLTTQWMQRVLFQTLSG